MYKIEVIENKIICGDCAEVMKRFPDECIDLIVTSPPYNIGIQYDSWNDRIPWDEYWRFTERWLGECFRVLKNDGRICINHYFSFGSGRRGYEVGRKKGTTQSKDDGNGVRIAPLFEIHRIATDIGYKHHAVVVWEDITLARKTAWGSWLSASSPYVNSPYEGILIMYKRQWKKEKRGITKIDKKEFVDLTRGRWKIPTEKTQMTKASFPIGLPNKCISLLSYEGDTVLDPFVGSGTTCLSAEKLSRKWVGIEISPKYAKIAENRIKQEQNQKKFNI